jgi:hypothetical protein
MALLTRHSIACPTCLEQSGRSYTLAAPFITTGANAQIKDCLNTASKIEDWLKCAAKNRELALRIIGHCLLIDPEGTRNDRADGMAVSGTRMDDDCNDLGRLLCRSKCAPSGGVGRSTKGAAPATSGFVIYKS